MLSFVMMFNNLVSGNQVDTSNQYREDKAAAGASNLLVGHTGTLSFPSRDTDGGMLDAVTAAIFLSWSLSEQRDNIVMLRRRVQECRWTAACQAEHPVRLGAATSRPS